MIRNFLLFFLVLPLLIAENTTAWAKEPMGERKKIQITVYNQDFALVKEEREVTLERGLNPVFLGNVAAQIEPTSVYVKSLTAPGSVRVLEQNYEYDLVHQAKLLEKYLGSEIEFEFYEPQTGKLREIKKARLLATGWSRGTPQQTRYYGYQPGGFYSTGTGMIVEMDDKIYMNPGGRMVLPEIPEGLILRPQLTWKLESEKSGRHKMEISYITRGINWNADYVAVIEPNEKFLDLTGWVTLDNRSGVMYPEAKLLLMAGDVRLVHPGQPIAGDLSGYGKMARSESARPQFTEKEFFEYHLYTLQRPTNVLDNQKKQIEFTSASKVPIEKLYVYDGAQIGNRWQGYDIYSIRTQPQYGTESNKKVFVMIEFMNKKKHNLGIPLPKGKVRVYKTDTDDSRQFVGEDLIDHTPSGEKLRLYVGNAFDIVGERKQTEFKKISERVIQETFEIRIRNQKSKEKAEVRVVEHLYRWNDWEILEKNHPYLKTDSRTIEFRVSVDPKEEKVINYTVQYHW